MSRNYYSEIHLHLVWHTKNSYPMLTSQIEPTTHRYLKQRLVNTPGVFVHEIGGTETHVHLCISIQPTVTISELIGQLKGASSHDVNKQFTGQGKTLQWQEGYGVVSFGTRDLEWVKTYVRNQKEHHAKGSMHARLEAIEAEERDAVTGQGPAETGKPRERG